MTKIAFNFFNTLTRTVEPFAPQNEAEVTIYTCGPTVYGYQHIGNYRTFIFEDVLVKALRRGGYSVKRVMNITDVGHLTSDGDEGQDKLEVGAERDGTTAWEVAEKYTESFLEDMRLLQMDIPNPLIRATDTIAEQIALVKNLEEKGFTYVTHDGVYFDSSKLADYGKLAHLDLEGLQAGARVEMGEKRRPTDFALWKFSPADSKRDMEWESPWGKGFPGWHLECSAIIQASLGTTIDIHTGGVDHIPVHHTNEIAQSETAHNQPLANLWMHADFLLVDGGKMAKSLGNLYTLSDLQAADIEPQAFRLFCYSASYRSKLNFNWEALKAAQVSLERLRAAYQGEGRGESTDISGFQHDFTQALAQDLNTAEALAVVWKALEAPLTGEARRQFLDEVDAVFSLNFAKKSAPIELPVHIQDLANQRSVAREKKDWQAADILRQQIEKAGYMIKDSAAGTEYYLAK